MSKETTNRELSDLQDTLRTVATDLDKAPLIKTWLEKQTTQPTSKIFTKDILSVLSDEFYKSAVIKTWLEKQTEQLTSEILKNILSVLSDEFYKANVIKTWLNKQTEQPTSEVLKNILSVLSDDRSKSSVIKTWLEKQTTEVTLKVLQRDILSVLSNDNGKADVIETWLEKQTKQPELEVFTQVILPAVSNDCLGKANVIKTWLEKQTTQPSLEVFKRDILSVLSNDNGKADVIETWLEKSPEEKRVDDLKEILKSDVSLRFRIDLTSNLLKIFNPNLENFSEFCKEVYPQGLLRIEFLKACVDEGAINEDHILQVKNILAEITEDNEVFNFLQTYSEKYQIESSDIFKILGDRTQTKFKSIHEVLKGIEITDSLSEDELRKLNENFDEDLGAIQSKNLSQLFSYYLVTKSVNEFVTLLSADTKAAIKSGFKASDEVVFFSKSEYENLKLLKADLELPKVEILCNLFRPKIQYPADLSEQEIKLHDLTLPKEKADKDTVLNFFKEIIGKENFEVISGPNKTKLVTFFNESRSELAMILGREDGRNKLSSLIFSAADGCSANIGTQIRLATYQALLENEEIEFRVLFRAFNSKIIFPVLNQGGDIIGSTSNPFKVNALQESVINPKGLIAGIKKEISNEEEGKILQENLGKEIVGKIYVDNPGQASDLAAYFVLKNTVANLLDAEFKKEQKSIIQNIKAEFKKEQQSIIQNIKNELEEEKEVSHDKKTGIKGISVDRIKESSVVQLPPISKQPTSITSTSTTNINPQNKEHQKKKEFSDDGKKGSSVVTLPPISKPPTSLSSTSAKNINPKDKSHQK